MGKREERRETIQETRPRDRANPPPKRNACGKALQRPGRLRPGFAKKAAKRRPPAPAFHIPMMNCSLSIEADRIVDPSWVIVPQRLRPKVNAIPATAILSVRAWPDGQVERFQTSARALFRHSSSPLSPFPPFPFFPRRFVFSRRVGGVGLCVPRGRICGRRPILRRLRRFLGPPFFPRRRSALFRMRNPGGGGRGRLRARPGI